MSLRLGDNVCVLEPLDTGIVQEIDEQGHHILLDHLENKLVIDAGKVRKMRWRYRNTFGRFLVIVVAKVNPFSRRRHLRIQYHVIRDNGSTSGVVNRIHRVNGIIKSR